MPDTQYRLQAWVGSLEVQATFGYTTLASAVSSAQMLANNIDSGVDIVVGEEIVDRVEPICQGDGDA